MSGIPSVATNLVSDGKRMREIWKPSDGDGHDNAGLVERSMNNIKGHPTWKVFMGEMPTAFQRGTQDEPPHYCYLDDYACHAVLASKAYTNEELNKFWPFDFNQQGVVKQGRKNRGRPAFTNDSKTDFVKTPMRSKKLLYVFSGEPQYTNYAPVRPKRLTKMEKQVEDEMAEEMAAVRSQAVEEIAKKTLVTTSEAAKKYSEAIIKGHATGRYPDLSRIDADEIRTQVGSGNQASRTLSTKKGKAKAARPGFPSYSPKPVSLPPCGASPSPFGKLTRGAPKPAEAGVLPEVTDQPPFNSMRKRRAASVDDTVSRKRFQLSDSASLSKASAMNLDGANDDEATHRNTREEKLYSPRSSHSISN
ncbi:hypothetical protein BDV96DRAFT_48166 [Lophiotrema nucula]|uniref:Uncharacterized protein n=1 Tax=Lophiotrema nucula TaxID=690887 RepID=A0A6A5ZD55_9PLEO|nr:hypothetical protein BDV96DRAFT_48166 [Lophiotrema nucula]